MHLHSCSSPGWKIRPNAALLPRTSKKFDEMRAAFTGRAPRYVEMLAVSQEYPATCCAVWLLACQSPAKRNRVSE